MADFVQTMRDWKRMCSAMEKLHPNDSCAGCRLEGYGCPVIYEDNSHVDYSDVEKNVTAWASEHPEPVYPTWEEWLVANGIMEPDNVRLNGGYRFYYNGKPVYNIPSSKMFDPISADIAEKLEIEPK